MHAIHQEELSSALPKTLHLGRNVFPWGMRIIALLTFVFVLKHNDCIFNKQICFILAILTGNERDRKELDITVALGSYPLWRDCVVWGLWECLLSTQSKWLAPSSCPQWVVWLRREEVTEQCAALLQYLFQGEDKPYQDFLDCSTATESSWPGQPCLYEPV